MTKIFPVALMLFLSSSALFAQSKECDRCTPFFVPDYQARCPTRPYAGAPNSGFVVKTGSWLSCISENKNEAQRQGATQEVWAAVQQCKQDAEAL